jgi:hypothetical protein
MHGWVDQFHCYNAVFRDPLYCRADKNYKILCLKIGKDGIKIFTWCFKEPCGSFLKNVSIVTFYRYDMDCYTVRIREKRLYFTNKEHNMLKVGLRME